MRFRSGWISSLRLGSGGLALGLGLLAGAAGCGGARGTEAAPTRSPGVPAESLGGFVRVVDRADHPRLTVVRRSGDPEGAVAVAFFSAGGSRSSLGLQALLETRLPASERVALELSSHELGFVAARLVRRPEEGPRFFQAVQAALAEPIQDEDPAIGRANALLEAARTSTRAPSTIAHCLGELGASGPEPLTRPWKSGELDELRREVATVARSRWGATGGEELERALEQATFAVWPPGDALDDPFPEKDTAGTSVSATGRELAVALWTSDSERALAAARVLRRLEHPLGARLRALGGRFEPSEVRVTLRPSGACLGLSLDQKAEAPPPDTNRAAEIALVARDELERTFSLVRPEEEGLKALLAPSSALEAAALAAWTSAHLTESPVGPRRLVELRAPAGDKKRPSSAEFEESLEQVQSAWKSHSIPLKSADERGQGEAWLLLATTCGTANESSEEAGLRGLTVRALATDFNGRDGVELEPWITAEGVGLLAHAPRLRDESPALQGARLGRALARAWIGDELQGSTVASERAAQLERLGDNPGRGLALQVLSGGVPALIDPRGTSGAVETFSSVDLERTRLALAGEPLRAAFLANAGEEQTTAAREALSEWLAPFRDSAEACRKPSVTQPSPGVWTLESVEPAVRPGTFLAVFRPGSRELGQATAFLLNRPGGLLERTLIAPELAASAEAEWFGTPDSGGLLLTLGAEPEQLPAAENQARALLARLAKGALTEEEARLARARQEELERQALRTPRGRVTRLWQEREPVPVSFDALRRFQADFDESRHLVIRLKNRK